jgi:tRNA (cmo5U34)-methyltransferase
MTNASEIFDAQAVTYEAVRRRLVPSFDAFYETAVSALDLAARPLERVLDLGAGTGLLSAGIAAAHPAVRLTLLDGAPAMLEQAKRLLGDRASTICADLEDPLPAGPWDAVVSALAIHHVADPAKRDLLGRVHAALTPGGLFVNAEQVAGPTALFDDLYARWHHNSALTAGASPEEWRGAEQRMRHDRCASVERQLAWLRDAGFVDADCLWKDHRFAVLVARRAG